MQEAQRHGPTLLKIPIYPRKLYPIPIHLFLHPNKSLIIPKLPSLSFNYYTNILHPIFNIPESKMSSPPQTMAIHISRKTILNIPVHTPILENWLKHFQFNWFLKATKVLKAISSVLLFRKTQVSIFEFYSQKAYVEKFIFFGQEFYCFLLKYKILLDLNDLN
jgi:hypothetical protein